MVFETSCWSGDGFNQNENSVQRRPKLDYFNVDAVKQTPIISHISSNGYYGYCPTTYTNNIVDTSMNGNSTTATATATATSMGNSGDFPMNDTITPMDTMRNDIQTTHIQQQHQGQSIDKRKRTNDQCNMIEIKRSRNCFSDCRIEGLCVQFYFFFLFFKCLCV